MSRNISEICLEIGKTVKRSGASPEACNKVDDLLVEINEARNEEISFWKKQMESALWKKQPEDMQEKTRLIDANAFIRSLDNHKGKPFTPELCATLVELFPTTCDTEAYLRGRTDQKNEDLDTQVVLTMHEIKVLQTSLIKKILDAIEEEYDLDYGEMLLNPRNFYDLVGEFYPTVAPPPKADNEVSDIDEWLKEDIDY